MLKAYMISMSLWNPRRVTLITSPEYALTSMRQVAVQLSPQMQVDERGRSVTGCWLKVKQCCLGNCTAWDSLCAHA